jgi:hypothetical protein
MSMMELTIRPCRLWSSTIPSEKEMSICMQTTSCRSRQKEARAFRSESVILSIKQHRRAYLSLREVSRLALVHSSVVALCRLEDRYQCMERCTVDRQMMITNERTIHVDDVIQNALKLKSSDAFPVHRIIRLPLIDRNASSSLPEHIRSSLE